MPTLRDDAICVRHWDWSETSQTVSLLTREHGLIRGIAKGAKREKAPFSGGLELLTRGEVVAIAKPTTELANITAWDLQESFPSLRRSLSAFHAGMYMADVAQHVVHDRDPHPRLYGALVDGLHALTARTGANRLAVAVFQWEALSETGWKPELERDVSTGGELQHKTSYTFSPALGGFSSAQSDGWRVRAETLELLRSIAKGRTFDAAEDVSERCGRLLDAYLATVLGRPLAAAEAYFGSSARGTR